MSDKNIKGIRVFDTEIKKFKYGKDINEKIILVKIPKNTILYQGTDYDFDRTAKKRLSNSKSNDNVSSDLLSSPANTTKIYKINVNKYQINNYYDYYDKRNKGTYFLSSYKTANLYGLDKDYTTIIYSSIIDLNAIYKPKIDINNIYPLYYISKKCFTIKYNTVNDVYLLNIGNIDTIRLIWTLLNDNELFNIHKKEKTITDEDINIIKELKNKFKAGEISLKEFIDKKFDINKLKLTKSQISDYKYSLYSSCANDENADIDKDIPSRCKRISDYSDDSILIEIFKLLHIYFLTKNITINGWIYYGSEHFHQEILILNRDYLNIKDIYTRKLTKFDNIPNYDDYMKKIKSSIIPYNEKSKKNNILHNYIIPNVSK